MKIIIIEDEPDTLTVYSEFLACLGFSQVELVTSSKQFRDKKNIEKLVCEYDLVICDINMPDVRGHEILKEFISLRNKAKEKPLFIIITGVPSSYFALDKEGWGELIMADEILGKPIEFNDFKSALRRLGVIK